MDIGQELRVIEVDEVEVGRVPWTIEIEVTVDPTPGVPLEPTRPETG